MEAEPVMTLEKYPMLDRAGAAQERVPYFVPLTKQ